MSEQMAFEFLPIRVPTETGMTIEESFGIFHRANPHIYRLLRQMALEYKRAGNARCGMKMLWEVLRYHSAVQTRGEPYKLNNNYTALYARELMRNEPELRGFFETRERRAD
jgi:hypothetical protein